MVDMWWIKQFSLGLKQDNVFSSPELTKFYIHYLDEDGNCDYLLKTVEPDAWNLVNNARCQDLTI